MEHNFIQELDNKGRELALMGKHKQALGIFQEAHRAAVDTLNTAQEIHFKRSMAHCYYSIGQYNSAIELYSLLSNIDKPDNNHESLGWDHYYLGEIYKDRSEFEKAIQNYKKAIKFFSKKGNRHLGLPLSALGNLYYLQGRFKNAAQMVYEHFTHARSIHFDESFGLSYITFGLLLFTKDDALNKVIHKINKVLNKKPSPFECFYTAIKLSRENNYLETELIALKVASLYYQILCHLDEARLLDEEFDNLIKQLGKTQEQKQIIENNVTKLFHIHHQ